MSEIISDPYKVINELTSSWSPNVKIWIWNNDYETLEAAQEVINQNPGGFAHHEYYISRQSQLEADIAKLVPNSEFLELSYCDAPSNNKGII